MGRGRAKAKQTKVARELKYNSPNTDLTALQAELAGIGGVNPSVDDDSDEEFTNDPYAKYYDNEDEEDSDTQDKSQS